jgi:hypothetical protein
VYYYEPERTGKFGTKPLHNWIIPPMHRRPNLGAAGDFPSLGTWIFFDALYIPFFNGILLPGVRRNKGSNMPASGENWRVFFVPSYCALLCGTLSLVYGYPYIVPHNVPQGKGRHALPKWIPLGRIGNCSEQFSRQKHCLDGFWNRFFKHA